MYQPVSQITPLKPVEAEIFNEIRKLKIGLDSIPTKLRKSISHDIMPLFQKSSSSSLFRNNQSKFTKYNRK